MFNSIPIPAPTSICVYTCIRMHLHNLAYMHDQLNVSAMEPWVKQRMTLSRSVQDPSSYHIIELLQDNIHPRARAVTHHGSIEQQHLVEGCWHFHFLGMRTWRMKLRDHSHNTTQRHTYKNDQKCWSHQLHHQSISKLPCPLAGRQLNQGQLNPATWPPSLEKCRPIEDATKK